MDIAPSDLREMAADKSVSKEQKLRAVSEQFEALFIGQLLKEMRNSVQTNALMGEDSNAMRTFQEMWDTEIAKLSAQGPGLGLGKMIYEQLSKVYLNPPQGAAAAVTPTNTNPLDKFVDQFNELKNNGAAASAKTMASRLNMGI